nr:beta-propeller domain-containing protein [uncultured Sphingomonas sp.]
MGFRTVAMLCLGGVGIAGIALSGLPYSSSADAQQVRARGSLASFGSDAALLAFLKKREAAQQKRWEANPPPPPPPAPMAAPPSAAETVSAQPVAKSADSAINVSRAGSDKITNTQEASVDEGGIVKKRGDILVILRRGRLFTVSVAGGGIRPIDHINAFPPGVTGQGDWYDEMLISGDRVVVIGYSYARGGTEVNRFRLSPDGKLRFEDAYHLRSNDYYSSRNYASRLIGNRLIYYTPLYLNGGGSPFDSFPAVSRWSQGGKNAFKRIAGGRDTYVVPSMRDDEDAELSTLHTVMDCDLTAPVMNCKATAVLGPDSRTFYVSPTAVYLWVSGWSDNGKANPAWLYRIPLNRSERPSAIGTMGQPTDQFSFREDGRNGLIDVLVHREGGGDAMWRSENNPTDLALLSVPIAAMGDGTAKVRRDRYRFLPAPGSDSWNFQNRFVGNHVLYGGHGYRGGQQSMLYAVGLRGGPITQLPLPHAVERLDQMGSDGIVIGSSSQGALTFTSIILDRPKASLGSAYAFPNAQQGEQRSQAFYFRQDNGSGTDGLLGLPITRSVESQYARFLGNAASILYLKRDNRQLSEAGRLDADYYRAVDDKCTASCVDWYGNARPIFIGNRVFALMGYELVEGRQDARGRIGEVQRANFAPIPPSR